MLNLSKVKPAMLTIMGVVMCTLSAHGYDAIYGGDCKDPAGWMQHVTSISKSGYVSYYNSCEFATDQATQKLAAQFGATVWDNTLEGYYGYQNGATEKSLLFTGPQGQTMLTNAGLVEVMYGKYPKSVADQQLTSQLGFDPYLNVKSPKIYSMPGGISWDRKSFWNGVGVNGASAGSDPVTSKPVAAPVSNPRPNTSAPVVSKPTVPAPTSPSTVAPAPTTPVPPIVQKDPVQQPTGNPDDAFLNCLYQKYFNRVAESWGKQYWSAQLANGMTRADVEKGFLYSGENCHNYIDAAFQRLLGRAPSSEELPNDTARCENHNYEMLWNDICQRRTGAAQSQNCPPAPPLSPSVMSCTVVQ